MALRELTAVRQPLHSSIGGKRPAPCGTAAKYHKHDDRSRPPALCKGQLISSRDLNNLWAESSGRSGHVTRASRRVRACETTDTTSLSLMRNWNSSCSTSIASPSTTLIGVHSWR